MNNAWWSAELCPSPALTDHTRNLGIVLGSKLSLKKQVNAVSSACFDTLHMQSTPEGPSRKPSSPAGWTTGTHSNVGITARLLKRLQTIQNSAARLILSLPKRTHNTPHLKKLHWLLIQKRCQFKLLTHAYKAMHNEGPAYINKRMTFHQPTRHLRSASLFHADILRIRRSNSGGLSFSHLVAKTWNDLPLHFRTAPAIQERTQDLAVRMNRSPRRSS